MISLAVNGVRIYGWESVEISKSMTSLCGTFSLSQSATRDGVNLEHLPVFPGDRVQIWRDDVLIMTGFVDDTSPSIDSSSHTIGVSGREITGDLVDCGLLATGKNAGTWRTKITLPQLITQLVEPFGIKCSSAGGADVGEAFPKFSAEPGDSIFTTIQKACILRGVLPMTAGDGSVILVQEGKGHAKDALVYGVNIKKASGKFSLKDRYSVYIVRGSANTSGDFFGAGGKFGFEARATDSGVPRYRPLVISAGSDVPDQVTAQRRANWEASTRAAKAGTVEVDVLGWVQSNGALWACAQLVTAQIPPILGPSPRDLLISSVKLHYSASGETATLDLVQPGAYAPEPGIKKAKDVKAKNDSWADVKKAVQG